MTTPAGGPAGDGPEERDSGLAQERTALSWTRTAISFVALGGTMLKENVIGGLIIVAIAPVIWQIGRVTRGTVRPAGERSPAIPVVGATRLFLIAGAIVAVSVVCLVVAIVGRSAPGALR